MVEIRFHGRGGQGTVVASIILGKAYFDAGYYVQTFPVFGVERRGAPVEAYLRLDKKKIRIRSNVYTPDHIMVQDLQLLGTIDITKGLKPGGWILLNARKIPQHTDQFSGFRVAIVDASAIALANQLGTQTHPMVNTAMVGAFARVMGNLPLASVTKVIGEEIAIKTQQNVLAAQQAYEQVNLMDPLID